MNWPASTWNWKCREVKHIHIFKKQMEKITPNTLQKYTCQKVVLKFESNYAYSTCPTVSKRQYNILKYCSKLILYINYRQYTINSYQVQQTSSISSSSSSASSSTSFSSSSLADLSASEPSSPDSFFLVSPC